MGFKSKRFTAFWIARFPSDVKVAALEAVDDLFVCISITHNA